MNKSHAIILIILTVLSSCSHFGNTPLQPSKEEALHFISVIPDHQIFPGTRGEFTKEYYNQLTQAWAIPSDGIGEIGSDEWLYYFITGNGDCPDFRIENITIMSHRRNATIQFVAYSCQQSQQHTINLKYEHGSWRIADYDDTLEELKKYRQQQLKYFKSSEWQEYINKSLATPGFSEIAKQRQQEVTDWLKKQ